MPLLMLADLHALHAAAVNARLAQQRAGLLAGIDAHFVSLLPVRSNASEQLLSDLDVLSKTGALADGSVPLLAWLDNAAHLAGPLVEAAVFKRVRASLQAPPAPPKEPITPLPRADLIDALHRMLPAAFETVLLRIGAPAAQIAGREAPQATRAADLINWADQAGVVDELGRVVVEVTGRRARP